MPDKKKKYTEGRSPILPSPQVKPTVQPVKTTLQKEMTELMPDISPTVDEEICVFPEAHKQVEEIMEQVSKNPWAKYMVMGEILGKPKSKR